MNDWTREEYLELIGITISGIIAVALYFLQKRLSDKQKVDHRLEVEEKAGQKLREIRHEGYSTKIQIYNSKLLNKKYFTENKRDIFWGYPFHGAGFHEINFDGLEFVVAIEEWGNKKYVKVGVIPYERILGVKPEGDGSFNGMIVYVKPRLLQLDKYAIAYKEYRYYVADERIGIKVRKPFVIVLKALPKKLYYSLRYNFYLRWKFKFQNRQQK